MNSGNIIRLKITAFKSSKYRDKKKVGSNVFSVQANPDTYAISFSVQYKTRRQQASGTHGWDPSWDKNPPRKLSFKFIFDETGAIPSFGEPVLPVKAQIKQFKETVFNISGDTHAPNYLRIEWGTLIFTCRLENMTITYKLFSPEGYPLRAEANASFIEVLPDKKRVRKPKKKSPDVTELHTVEDGDNLPELVEEKYGDVGYYLAVAQANKLLQFRNLKAGEKIIFPPIQKR